MVFDHIKIKIDQAFLNKKSKDRSFETIFMSWYKYDVVFYIVQDTIFDIGFIKKLSVLTKPKNRLSFQL